MATSAKSHVAASWLSWLIYWTNDTVSSLDKPLLAYLVNLFVCLLLSVSLGEYHPIRSPHVRDLKSGYCQKINLSRTVTGRTAVGAGIWESIHSANKSRSLARCSEIEHLLFLML